MGTNEAFVQGQLKAGGRVPTNTWVSPGAKAEEPVNLSDNITVYGGCSIGRWPYINVGTGLYANSSVGRFCSIGRWCEIGLARHPVKFLSTHPFQMLGTLYPSVPEYAEISEGTKIKWQFHPNTKVGHDCWLGAKACIASGVTIGHGAVVGAGAVVTKDVAPYSIVGGVPAVVIGQRFPDEIIADLLEINWWDMPASDLKGIPFNNIIDAITELKRRKAALQGAK